MPEKCRMTVKITAKDRYFMSGPEGFSFSQGRQLWILLATRCSKLHYYTQTNFGHDASIYGFLALPKQKNPH
jgi:hypothetical protein